jgi:hypothetical protein
MRYANVFNIASRVIMKIKADPFDEVLGIWGRYVLVLLGSTESETVCSSSKVSRLVCLMSPMTRLLGLFVVEQPRI